MAVEEQFYLSNYTEQSPYFEGKNHSARQEFSHLLQAQKIYCRVHKRPPFVSVLR
jgi:hypothetical protein